MTRRKLIVYLREHPFLLDAGFVMKTSEAQSILDSAQLLTFKEMIDGAKKRYPQYSPKQWFIFDQVIAKRDKKLSVPMAGDNAITRPHKNHYGKLAVASIIAIIIMFFTLVPAGRAFAKEIYNYTINIFGNLAEITQQSSNTDWSGQNDADLSDESSGALVSATGVVTYASVEEFEKKTGLKPFLLYATWLSIINVQGEYDPDFGQTIWIIYSDVSGNEVRLIQEWFQGEGMSAITSDDSYKQIDIRGAYTLYYGIDPTTGTFDGISLLDDSILLVGADVSIDIDKLIESLK